MAIGTCCDDGPMSDDVNPVAGHDDEELLVDDDLPLDDQVAEPQPMDFAGLTDLQVFGRWAEVMVELAARELIWSGKSPLADYAELLIARHYGVEPLKGTNPGYDLVTKQERRVQVKSRRYGPGSNPTHFGDISNFEKEGFDDFVGVLFEADFTVRCAYLATYDWVAKNGTVVQGKQRVNIGSFLAAADADQLEKLDLDQS